MMALSTGVPGSSLSELYLECIQSFGEFLLALSGKDCRVICLEQVRLSELLEAYGRTKVWGDQTKAELPAGARGSLDDTLRHDVELKYLVQAILMRLRALLKQATYIAGRKHNPVLGSDHDSISSVSADSDSGSNDDGEHQHYRMPKIRLLVQQTLEQIRSLYDMSALLRRPKIADKYIRSVNSRSHIATLNKPDHLPLSVGFSRSDEAHIVEKVLQWRGLTKSAWGIDFKVEIVAPIGQGLTNNSVEDILWFCQRLAAANTRRREQFQYWRDHPYDHRQDTTNAARLATPDLAQSRVKQVEEKQEQQNRALTFKPSIPDVPRGGPRSAVSKQSFSTAAVSDIHDTKTNVRPRTVYAPTAFGQDRSNSVPDPPKIEIGTTFSCPYCGMTLESSEMKNRQSWKRHVFRDLRPYVCTFEDCQNGGKLYVSRHDWMHHELQIHRRNYACKICQKMCSSRQEMSVHLREHYDESIPPNQLGVILDLCNRQVDILEYEKHSCLVCGDELLLSALQGHLAAHMEDIALFVLPNTNEEEDIGDSKASVRVAKLESKGKTSGTKSDASSLGYSAAGDYRQISTDFLKLLTSEEAGYTSKFLAWRTIDDDLKSAPVKQMMETRKTKLGADHPDTLTSMVNLASTYSNQGRWEEAEAMHWRALQAREKVLGLEHPDTLASVSNLGSVLDSQGKYEEAEAIHRRALQAREKVLGLEHLDTLTSISNFGSVLYSQGKYEEAEAIHRRALQAREKVLGLEHPDTLASVSNLGLVLFRQGKYEEAEAIHRRALQAREKVLGLEHLDTLTSISNFGSVLYSQGKYEEAEAMHRRALQAREKVLGLEHLDTLTSISNFGSVLYSQGKYEEAEAMHRRALQAREKVLGLEHLDTLTSISNFGSVLNSQGKYEEAEAMHRRALQGYKDVLGLEHPYTLTSISNLGSVLDSQGKYEEAEAMHRRDLEGSEKVLGLEHPDTLTSVSNLSSVLDSQGKYEEAEAIHRRALQAREKVLRSEHPDTLATVSNLGSVLDSQGKYEEAEAMHWRNA